MGSRWRRRDGRQKLSFSLAISSSRAAHAVHQRRVRAGQAIVRLLRSRGGRAKEQSPPPNSPRPSVAPRAWHPKGSSQSPRVVLCGAGRPSQRTQAWPGRVPATRRPCPRSQSGQAGSRGGRASGSCLRLLMLWTKAVPASNTRVKRWWERQRCARPSAAAPTRRVAVLSSPVGPLSWRRCSPRGAGAPLPLRAGPPWGRRAEPRGQAQQRRPPRPALLLTPLARRCAAPAASAGRGGKGRRGTAAGESAGPLGVRTPRTRSPGPRSRKPPPHTEESGLLSEAPGAACWQPRPPAAAPAAAAAPRCEALPPLTPPSAARWRPPTGDAGRRLRRRASASRQLLKPEQGTPNVGCTPARAAEAVEAPLRCGAPRQSISWDRRTMRATCMSTSRRRRRPQSAAVGVPRAPAASLVHPLTQLAPR